MKFIKFKICVWSLLYAVYVLYISVQIVALEKHDWTFERSKNVSKSWESRPRKVIGVSRASR
jgi:hypothetical protein